MGQGEGRRDGGGGRGEGIEGRKKRGGTTHQVPTLLALCPAV